MTEHNYQEHINEMLNQLEQLILSTNTSKDEVEYFIEYDQDENTFLGSIKFKQSEDFILTGITMKPYIFSTDAQYISKMLKGYTLSKNFTNYVNPIKVNIYPLIAHIKNVQLYSQPFIPVESHPDVLFFPIFNVLFLKRTFEISAQNQTFISDFLFLEKNVTKENFEKKLNKIISNKDKLFEDLISIKEI